MGLWKQKYNKRMEEAETREEKDKVYREYKHELMHKDDKREKQQPKKSKPVENRYQRISKDASFGGLTSQFATGLGELAEKPRKKGRRRFILQRSKKDYFNPLNKMPMGFRLF